MLQCVIFAVVTGFLLPVVTEKCVKIINMPCRWFKRRIRRYQHIQGRFSDDLLMWTYDIDVGHVPPLLPSLLVTCAPSAELSLTVHACEGKTAMASDWGTI